MLHLEEENKNIFRFIIIILCLLAGFYFVKIFQTPVRSVKIYKEALKDFQNGNYSNAYYLFSRISFLSPLKSFAIYRQGLCARALGDSRSELRAYQTFLHRYPANKLSTEIKYEAGQLLVESNPVLAQKYFNSVLKSADIDENYKIAAQYYIARISAVNIKYSNKKISDEKSDSIENSFRQYLEKAPDGRLATSVANTWIKFNPNLAPKDVVIVSRSYYLANNSEKALQLLANTTEKDNWSIKASSLFAKNEIIQAKELVEKGVSQYSDETNQEDYKRAVNDYINSENSQYSNATKLLNISKGKGRDYIHNLKCESSSEEEKTSCYNELYTSYPKGDYAAIALSYLFSDRIKKQQYVAAKQIGRDYLKNFPKSEAEPMVMFWMGKIAQKLSSSMEAGNYYQNVINNYPDSYYAYRAFWLLKGVKSGVVKADIEYRPVIYPYKTPVKGSILNTLIKVNDYDLMLKFTDDEFIKSWIEYQKGNYAVSVHTAEKAMEQLEEKPLKSDMRWRLVYPQNYYKQVQNESLKYGNNDALIMAILREESYFNMYAQSDAGAMGLMQLMPSTAHEIGSKNGINFNTTGLFNPELNIKLGNLYYSFLREQLKNQDVVAVAAYNGGIGSVNNWQNNLSYSDIDEFIEQIPYEETKNYVKKIFKSYWNYLRIYQK